MNDKEIEKWVEERGKPNKGQGKNTDTLQPATGNAGDVGSDNDTPGLASLIDQKNKGDERK